jgi:hypothetical protein
MGVVKHAFTIGDHVRWSSKAGHINEKITEEVHTKNTGYKRHICRCPDDDPKYEIKSDKTDHLEKYKGSALRRID